MRFPKIFCIETVLGCNLGCVECAVGSKLVTRKYGMMTKEQFCIIAPKIQPYCSLAYMFLWGEPMLNPEIIPMLQQASQFTTTCISTNANTLTEELAAQLIDSGVSSIIVSIDGITQETYEVYRRRGNLSAALRGLSYLIRYKILHHSKVGIEPQFIVFDHNKHEIAAFSEFCAELGLAPTFKSPYLRHNSALKTSGIASLERPICNKPNARRNDMRSCSSMNDDFTILLDGSVVACCYDHNAITTFGNIFTQSVEEIWTSPAYVQFRHNVQTGDAPTFCLENCLSH